MFRSKPKDYYKIEPFFSEPHGKTMWFINQLYHSRVFGEKWVILKTYGVVISPIIFKTKDEAKVYIDKIRDAEKLQKKATIESKQNYECY